MAQGRRLQECWCGDSCEELCDDVVEVLLRAQALPFEHFHNGGDLPHVGDGRFFDRHALAWGGDRSFAFRCPLPCQLLCLGNLIQGHFLGQLITKGASIRIALRSGQI